MTRPLCAVLLALLAVPASLSQVRVFEPGYVVRDGVREPAGVSLGLEHENARGAWVRTAGGAEVQVDASEVEAFGVDGGRAYRRGRFETEVSRDAADPMPRLGFARVVRDGAADLLAYEPAPGFQPVWVLVLDGEQTSLLAVDRDVNHRTGARRSRLELFRQVLLVRLGACGVAEADVAGLPYAEDALAGVVDAYNACREPGIAVEAAPAVRRADRLAFEVGAGYGSGTLRRASPLSGSDPSQPAGHLRVRAVVTPGALPQALSFLFGAEFQDGLVYYSQGGGLGPARNAADRDALALSLGVRLTARVAGTPVYVGGAVLNGRTLANEPQALPEDGSGEGFLPVIRPWLFDSFGARAVEVGARPLGGRFGLSAEYRSTEFSWSKVYVPLIAPPQDGRNDNRYALRSFSVTASARF